MRFFLAVLLALLGLSVISLCNGANTAPASGASSTASESPSSAIKSQVVAKEYDARRPPERVKIDIVNPRHPYGRYDKADVTEAVDVEERRLQLPRPVNSGFGAAPSAHTTKVFGVGLSRTGTSSLTTALLRLGLKCIHFDRDFTPYLPSGRRLRANVTEQEITQLSPRQPSFEPQSDYNYQGVYDDVDCVLDLPTAFYYREMMEVYPQAVFISTEREVESWYQSFASYLDTVEDNIFPGANLPITARLMHKHVYGSELPNHDLWTASFVAHYRQVKASIPAEKLLNLHLHDFRTITDFNPFPQICELLGLKSDECSKDPYPRSNANNKLDGKIKSIRTHALQAYQPLSSPLPATAPFAYLTLLADVNANSFKQQFLNAVMVFCHTVHNSYDDVTFNAEGKTAATRYQRSADRPYDMVLFTMGDVNQDQLELLYTCFDRILPVRNFGEAPRHMEDSRYYSIIRAKFWSWSLTEYKRITFLDADQMVVRNLDSYFFREFYAQGKSSYDNTNIIPDGATVLQQDGEQNVLPLYTVLSSHSPICSSMFNLEPSIQAVIDIDSLFKEGRWDAVDGWNEYGAFDFQPDTVTISMSPASSPWKSNKMDDMLPYVPLFPVPQFGNTAWKASDWSFYCSWSDQGMLFYYFFMLRPIGGIIDSADIDHSVIHFIGVHKPWVFNNRVAINDYHGDKWKPVVALWKQFAHDMKLPLLAAAPEAALPAPAQVASKIAIQAAEASAVVPAAEAEVNVKDVFASFHESVGKLAHATSRNFRTACYGYGVGCGCIITTDPNGNLGTCSASIADGVSCNIGCNGGTTKNGAITQCSNGVLVQSQSCTPNSCTLPSLPSGVTAGGCTPGATLNSGSSCTYTAIGGWSLTGNSLTITCNTASLTAGPVMSPNPCGAPGLNTGFSQGGCGSGVSSGSSCTLSLNSGYTLSAGSLTMTCSAGSYTAAVPTATANGCPAPSLNAGFTVGGCAGTTNSGNNCVLSLNSGYTLSTGSLTMTCFAGSFTAAVPTATENPCTLPALPTGVDPGSCTGPSINSGTSCTYTGQAGYFLSSGSFTINCFAASLTVGPTMTGNPCSAPGLTTGLSIGGCGGSTSSGSSCSLSLNSGYSLSSGSLTLSCSLGNFGSLPSVSPDPCVAPVAPTGTTIGNCGSGVTSGSTCTLVQVTGYSIASGSLTLGCTAAVLDPLPTFTEDPCTLPALPNGVGANTCSPASIASQTSCTYTQLTGWHLVSGSFTINCVRGVLSTGPTMDGDACPAPVLPTGLSLGSCTSSTLDSTSCTLSLNFGYSLASGSLTLSCSLGQFGTLPTVTPNPCAAPVAPTGTTIGNCGSGVTSGSSCTLVQLTGYTIATGSLTLHCMAQVLDPLPTFTENPCPLPALPTGAAPGTCTPASINSRASCTYIVKGGWTFASGSLTVNCLLGVLSVGPTITPDPCPAPILPPGLISSTCSAPTPSGGSCALTVDPMYVLDSGSLTLSCLTGVMSALPVVTVQVTPVTITCDSNGVVFPNQPIGCTLKLAQPPITDVTVTYLIGGPGFVGTTFSSWEYTFTPTSSLTTRFVMTIGSQALGKLNFYAHISGTDAAFYTSPTPQVFQVNAVASLSLSAGPSVWTAGMSYVYTLTPSTAITSGYDLAAAINLPAGSGFVVSPSSVSFSSGSSTAQTFTLTAPASIGVNSAFSLDFSLSGADAYHYVLAGGDGKINILPCVFTPCSTTNSQCANVANPSANQTFTCVCNAGFTGNDCLTSLSTIPPVANLVAPSGASNCHLLRLDGSASYRLGSGAGYGSDSKFIFGLASARNSTSNTEFLDTGLALIGNTYVFVPGTGNTATLTFPFNGAKVVVSGTLDSTGTIITVNANELPTGTYQFRLQVVNAGGSSNPSFATVAKTDVPEVQWLPELQVSAPSNVVRGKATSLAVNIIDSNCQQMPANAVFSFNWKVSQIDATGAIVTSVYSSSARGLVIPAFTLTTNNRYEATVTATITNGLSGVDFTYTLSSDATFFVGASSLQATIQGSSRSRSSNLPISFDGSKSNDPDNNGALSFAWSYALDANAVLLGKYASKAALAPLPAASVNAPVLNLEPNFLPPSAAYTFTLTVSNSLDGRSSSASVNIESLVPTDAPLVVINSPASDAVLGNNAAITVAANVVSQKNTPSYQMQYSWSVDTDATPRPTAADINSWTSYGSSTLIVPKGALPAGSYTFTLNVTDPNVPDESSSASVHIDVASAPYGGTCTVAPHSGYGLSSSFAATCTGWATTDPGQLTYTSYLIDPAHPELGEQLLSDPFTLPVGSGLQVKTYITNSAGSSASFVTLLGDVTQSPDMKADPICFIDNIINTRLTSTSSEDPTVLLTLAGQLAQQLTTLNSTSSACGTVQSEYAKLVAAVAALGQNLSSDDEAYYLQALESLTTGSAFMDPTTYAQLNQLLQDAIKNNAGLLSSDPELLQDLAVAASNMLTDCSKMDMVRDMITKLLSDAMQGTVEGESRTFTTPNFVATSTRSALVAGANITLGTGVNVTLTPDAVAAFAAQYPQSSNTSIDFAANGAPLLDTNVVSFSPAWASCRSANTGNDNYNVTDITLTLSDGSTLDVSKLPQPITFSLPLTTGSDSAMNTALTCPQDLECHWWDNSTQSWSTAGCSSVTGPTGLQCTCNHLTEFSILSREEQGLQSKCAPAVMLGGNRFLIFLILYSVLGTFSLIQSARVVNASGFKRHWLTVWEHGLIAALALSRALNQAVYWKLFQNISVSAQVLLAGIPYVFYPFVYTLVIMAWMAIFHSSNDLKRKMKNPFQQYRSRFFTVNGIICGVLLLLTVVGARDPTSLDNVNRATVVIIFVLSVALAAFFGVYGCLLYNSLTAGGSVSHYAARIRFISLALPAMFVAGACMLLYSIIQPDNYDAHFDVMNSIYFSFDLCALILVLALFAKSVNDAVKLGNNNVTSLTGPGSAYSVGSSAVVNGSTVAPVKVAPQLAKDLDDDDESSSEEESSDDSDESEVSSEDDSGATESKNTNSNNSNETGATGNSSDRSLPGSVDDERGSVSMEQSEAAKLASLSLSPSNVTGITVAALPPVRAPINGRAKGISKQWMATMDAMAQATQAAVNAATVARAQAEMAMKAMMEKGTIAEGSEKKSSRVSSASAAGSDAADSESEVSSNSSSDSSSSDESETDAATPQPSASPVAAKRPLSVVTPASATFTGASPAASPSPAGFARSGSVSGSVSGISRAPSLGSPTLGAVAPGSPISLGRPTEAFAAKAQALLQKARARAEAKTRMGFGSAIARP